MAKFFVNVNGNLEEVGKGIERIREKSWRAPE